MFNPASYPDRHLSMESIYEYGSRAGVWRILREFEKRRLPLTVFGVGMALQRHPELASACVELGHEIACHGWRWVHYQDVDEATEREHMFLGMQAIEQLTGARPLGWYTGRDSPHAPAGGRLWRLRIRQRLLRRRPAVLDAGAQSDGKVVPQLIVPYTLDCNDMRFALPQGYSTPSPSSST